MLALDLDTGPDDLEVLDEPGGPPDLYLDDFDPDFDSVEPDVAEVAYLDGIPFSGVMQELLQDGRSPPSGWRWDNFPPNGTVVLRTVYTPPLSLRPLTPSLRIGFH